MSAEPPLMPTGPVAMASMPPSEDMDLQEFNGDEEDLSDVGEDEEEDEEEEEEEEEEKRTEARSSKRRATSGTG